MGTVEVESDGTKYNASIVLHDGNIRYVPKTKVLDKERRCGISPGMNPGVFDCGKFRLGILVCADLWDPLLVQKLVINKVDVIAVPAWTATATGNRQGTRLDWYSLARSTSTAYGVVVAVADHMYNYESSDVGNATIIFSPSNRNKAMLTAEFVPRDVENIDVDAVRAARERWISKGLMPMGALWTTKNKIIPKPITTNCICC
jgi:predicted amidohydrolase